MCYLCAYHSKSGISSNATPWGTVTSGASTQLGASVNATNPGSGFGNIYLDTLIWGNNSWRTDTGPITYYFADQSDVTEEIGPVAYFNSLSNDPNDRAPDTALAREWSASEKDAFLQAFKLFEAVTPLRFQEADSFGAANLVEWKVGSDLLTEKLAGFHLGPDGTSPFAWNPNQVWGLFNESVPQWLELQRGGDGFNTIIHELGHGMGLAHPHDGGERPDATTFPMVTNDEDIGDGQNQAPFTVMSYVTNFVAMFGPANTAYGNLGGLGAFDVAALQAIYGANNEYRTGDDAYVLHAADGPGAYWTTIWDAGGIDTIDNSASILNSVIDLREAPLVGPHAGGYVSLNAGVQGGFTVANGVVIENAIGGSGSDRIIGNAADNVLSGGAGNDIIQTLFGNDVLHGDRGTDIVVLNLARNDVSVTTDQLGSVVLSYSGGSATLTSVEILQTNAGLQLLAAQTPHHSIPFDEVFFLEENADVAAAVSAGAFTSGFEHFVLFGEREGRDAVPLFDTSFYLASNSDVAAAVQSGAMTAYAHYLQFGAFEGRAASSFFDTETYYAENPDVAAAGVHPLQHLYEYGIAEGRILGTAAVEIA